MPKYFITILVLTVIAVGFVTALVLNTRIKANDIKIFNEQFEVFNKNRLTGADVSSAINKAINNNKKYEQNKEYLVDINIRIIDYGEETIVDMEKIYSLGIDNFIKYYGRYEFNCTKVEYNKENGRISTLNFQNN